MPLDIGAQSALEAALGSWAGGLVGAFRRVQALPYALFADVVAATPAAAAAECLARGGGSCTPKHFLLAAAFERLGLVVKYVTCPFTWSEACAGVLPPPLAAMARTLPVEYHSCLRVWIGGRWTLVDATWDPALAAAGFVAPRWDGTSDTPCAVAPLAAPEVEFETAEDRWSWVQGKYAAHSAEQRAARAAFFDAFNRWADGIRAAGTGARVVHRNVGVHTARGLGVVARNVGDVCMWLPSLAHYIPCWTYRDRSLEKD
jgi:hypothetical protein